MEHVGPRDTKSTASIFSDAHQLNWERTLRQADNGDDTAQRLLFNIFFHKKHCKPEVIDYYARLPNPPAYISLLLGAMYFSGRAGNVKIDKNLGYAKFYFDAASEGGIAHADYLIGKMYCSGYDALPNQLPDFKSAVMHYQKAYDAGHAKAAKMLGHMFQCGKGVKENIHISLGYYEKAKERRVAGLEKMIAILEDLVRCAWTESQQNALNQIAQLKSKQDHIRKYVNAPNNPKSAFRIDI